MSLSQFQLPTEFSMENIGKSFLLLSNRIEVLEKNQNNTAASLQKSIDSKTSLTEVVSTFAQSIPYTASNKLYVDIYSFDGIVKGITEKITVKLQELADNVKQQEIMNEKLLIKVGQGIRVLQQKYEILEKKIKNLTSYTKNGFLQAFARKRLNVFFAAWRSEVFKRHRAKQLLLKTLKKVNIYPAFFSFTRWKTKDTKLQVERFERDKKSFHKASEEIKDEFFSMKSHLFALQQEKADALEINELKTVATKTDLRVLYGDIKSILVTYFSNLKTVTETQTNSLKFSELQLNLDDLKKNMSTKAEQFDVSELSLLASKLKQEVVDTNMKQKFLSEQFNEFSDSLQLKKTGFQLKVLENRIASLEMQMNEDPNRDLEFVDAVKMICSEKKAAPQHQMSLKLTDVIDRNMTLKNRKRFNTIITNKKT